VPEYKVKPLKFARYNEANNLVLILFGVAFLSECHSVIENIETHQLVKIENNQFDLTLIY